MTDNSLELRLRKTNDTNKLYNIVYTPKTGYSSKNYSTPVNYLLNKPSYNSTSQKSNYELTPSNLGYVTIKSSYLFSPQNIYSNASSGNYNPTSKGRWARENRKLWAPQYR